MSAQAFILLYGLPFLALFAVRERLAPDSTAGSVRSITLLFWAWLGLGLLIRLPLLWDGGFHYDIGTYKAWALKLSDPAAPFKIYEPGYFADYPPLYMYVLAGLGWFARTTGLDSTSHFTALIKLPALLCDLAVSLLLLRASRQDHSNNRQALVPLFLASLYWLNPAIIFDSALWGQSESVLALLVVGAWQLWRHQRLWAASLLLGLAVAFKPQGLIFAYVFGWAVVMSQPWQTTLRQIAIGVGSFIAVILPFALEQEKPDWILQLYFSTADTYNYLTVNAYNLYALLGWNWSRDAGPWLGLAAQSWAMLGAGALLTWIGIRAGLRSRDSTGSAQLGEEFGWALAMAAMVFFMFAPRMHERYILNIIPMLALLTSRRDVRIILLLWSAGVLANMGYVYHYYIDINEIAPRDSSMLRAISAYNVLVTLLTFAVWLIPAKLGLATAWLISKWHAIPRLPQPNTQPQPWAWRNALSYVALGAAALWIGVYQLGSQNYPQTGLVVKPGNILMHFAQPVLPKRAMIFIGEGEGKAVLEQQLRGDWQPISDELELKTFFDLYEPKLKNVELGQDFRLRIIEVSRPLRINEIGLLDDANQPLIAQPSGVREQRSLFDEAQTLQPDLGYFTSTEFDEIYHARTAHEYLHHLSIYETTHPPLGKWIISQGIKHYGMTPWGMRITGVVATVVIVLALIWGAWLLTGSGSAMWLVGLLGLFEFSRFSIGRYATIDPYVILFILVSALFLWRSFANHAQWLNGWRLTPNLLLAGLFLGAAIATKWNSLYYGIGLFAFFLYSLAMRVRVSANIQTNKAPPSVLSMLLSGAIAFGLIPLLLYYWSYTPFLRCLPHTPDLLSLEGAKQVWKSQVDMYNYHSQLTSTHSFSSPFYSWPLILKPLWLYVSDARAPLRSSITLMGNPLIWWTGALAIVALLGRKLAWPKHDKVWLLASIAALYLPWAGISRASFIYHYYPIVPFLILLVGVTLHRLPQEKTWQRILPWGFVCVAGLLFIAFFPAISGIAMPASYFKYLHWLPGWWTL